MQNHNLKLKIVSFALLLGAVFSFSCFISISAAELVDINTASLTQLDTLTGIGPALAQRIIDSRPYSSLDDLLKVKGIGPKNLEKIKTQDLACVNCQTLQNQQTLTQNQTTNAPATSTIATIPIPSSPSISLIPPIPLISPSPKTYPKNIFINEVLPSPEGADEQNEWLEIVNNNNFVVDMAGWQIKDQAGAIKTYTWPANSPLKAKGFLTVSREQSKIVLQNNGDGLTLTNPQGTMADQITYPASPANQSYNRTSSSWIWSRTLTPGQSNEIDRINTAVQQKIAQKNQTATSSTTTTQTSLKTAPLTAQTPLEALPLTGQINQFSPSTSKLPRIFTFLLGLVIAVASATMVVFLRKKQKK